MTTWSDESLPSTSWGFEFLLINATDILLIGATAEEYIIIEESTVPA
jgi:hypothetical protein